MPFDPISLRESMNKITHKEWVVPMTQRPYVWGDRTDYMKAIYRLFDSLFRSYPIGVFLIWKTEEEIQYREFMQDFDPYQPVTKAVEKGNWSRLKTLVYDGQQRLQTLYSCLQYRYAGKVLCFDLFFDPTQTEEGKYGFIFFPANSQIEPRYLRLNILFQDYSREGKDGVTTFRNKQKQLLVGASDVEKALAEKNIDKLWQLFNNEENRICGYFSISQSLKTDVQEIFVRLNTGGLPPSQADLVFSLMHVDFYDFQEKIQETVAEIQTATSIDLDAYDVLQFLYYAKFNTSRVDLDKMKSGETKQFQDSLEKAIEPLKVLYKRFLHDEYQINSTSILRSQLCILPILLYFYKNQFKDLATVSDLDKVKQYFILSQINDWSLQGILGEAGRLINLKPYFPLDEIGTYVSKTTRSAALTQKRLESLPTFVLKSLLPKKSYTYIKSRGRLNPELEHIFPRNPKEDDVPPNYGELVNDLWNLQLGVPADINGSRGKSNKMPNIFFADKPDILRTHYDFLPTLNLNDHLWDYHHIEQFLQQRKLLMLREFSQLHGLEVGQ